MRSTRLADLFYRLDINPFYVVAAVVFLVPVGSVVFFYVILSYEWLYVVIFTIIVFLLCAVLFYFYFHRNPNRAILLDDNSILSPADGRIVYIKKIKNGDIIESVKNRNHMRLTELLDIKNTTTVELDSSTGDGVIVGIELRLFDVHITRSPITGLKLLDHHVSGRIVSMNNPDFEYINDRETVVLRKEIKSSGSPGTLQIAVVQIATFITRTVKSFVQQKTQVTQGEPLGMIRLGSQVDLIIFSTDARLLVKEHDRVYAGITKIAEIS